MGFGVWGLDSHLAMLAKSSSLSMSENGSTSDGGISGVAAQMVWWAPLHDVASDVQMVWWTPLHDVKSDATSRELLASICARVSVGCAHARSIVHLSQNETSRADCVNVGAGKNPGSPWLEEACSSFVGVALSMRMAKAASRGAGTPLKCDLCRVCSLSCADASLDDDRGKGTGVSSQCSRNDALPLKRG